MSSPRLTSNLLSRLSPREKLLVGLAVAICFVMGALYLVRFPGEGAARSAASRNAQAAAELAEARTLASQGSNLAQQPAQPHLDRLLGLAAQHGLVIIDSRQADGAIVLRMSSENSAKVLAWAAEASVTAAPLSSLSITQDAVAGLAIEASFAGDTP